MKYPLAFLFVAATAILVTSAPPKPIDAPGPVPRKRIPPEIAPSTSITVEALNVLLNAREDNELLVDVTLAELHHKRQLAQKESELAKLTGLTAEPNFVPRDLDGLIEERDFKAAGLKLILEKLESAQNERAKAQEESNRQARNRKNRAQRQSGSTPNPPSQAELEEDEAKIFNAQALTVEELNGLLSELACNQAQRYQLAKIAYQNDYSQSEIEGLTNLRTNLRDWTIQALSEDKLRYLKRALRIFTSLRKEQFKKCLAQADVCYLHTTIPNNNKANDPDYIIAEKIFDSTISKLVFAIGRYDNMK